jgi:CspA family cold shock protein
MRGRRIYPVRILDMSNQAQSVTCQRCGSGFVLTTNYLDLLVRRNVKVVIPALCPTCFVRYGPLPKQRGRVKWFSSRKHYGFIVSEEGEELFFHERQLLGEHRARLEHEQPVLFHVNYAIKGPEALNVEIIGDGPST